MTMTVTTATSTPTGSSSVTITGTSGGISHTAGVSLTVAASSAFSIRVNAGGNIYTDLQEQVWAADTGYQQGLSYSTTETIAGTADQALFQTLRYSTTGSLVYQFSVSNGDYLVNLNFAELYYITRRRTSGCFRWR